MKATRTEGDMVHKGRYVLGESEVADQGRNSFEWYDNGYYKKEHRRTGFSNSYHKDESGNNSSFYRTMMTMGPEGRLEIVTVITSKNFETPSQRVRKTIPTDTY